MEKTFLENYMDACEMIKETEVEIRKLEKERRTIVSDVVVGSNPEWPYQKMSFTISGIPDREYTLLKLDRERERLERQKQEAQWLKGQVEEWMTGIPFRMQRIIRHKIFEKLTWEETAMSMGWKATGESVKKEFQRFMKQAEHKKK